MPITPHICILVCRPSRYREDPKLTTLMLDDHEVDISNRTVQVYAEKAIFFRSQQPVLIEEFKRGKHLQYAHPANPIDSWIDSIPGVPARDISLDHIIYPEGD